MRRSRRGFSLIELAIVMAIAGVSLGAFLQFNTARLQKQRYDTTQQRLKDARAALTLHVLNHKRLPCPASPADTGLRGDCARDEKQRVWTGTLPTRDLQLDPEQGVDGWGGKFTYAVSMHHTFQNSMRHNPPGDIAVINEHGNNMLEQPDAGRYVVVSHGPTGAGAWRLAGGFRPCQPDTLDSRNCNGGSIFVMAPWSTNPGGNFYDDIVMHDNPNDTRASMVDMLITCNAREAFYNPNSATADADGCVRPPQPEMMPPMPGRR